MHSMICHDAFLDPRFKINSRIAISLFDSIEVASHLPTVFLVAFLAFSNFSLETNMYNGGKIVRVSSSREKLHEEERAK